MKLKEKIIGLALILLGALPFLLKIEKISNFFTQSKILSYFTPGEIIYQIAIIILGILLIWTLKNKI